MEKKNFKKRGKSGADFWPRSIKKKNCYLRALLLAAIYKCIRYIIRDLVIVSKRRLYHPYSGMDHQTDQQYRKAKNIAHL